MIIIKLLLLFFLKKLLYSTFWFLGLKCFHINGKPTRCLRRVYRLEQK